MLIELYIPKYFITHAASLHQGGGQGYNRLRFGIGNDFPQGYQVDFVLSKFTSEEEQIVDERALVACDAIKAFALSGMQFAMCNYNNK